MSTWRGWQADLLSAVNLPNTENNRRFLSDWHANANTNCRLNPVDLHIKEPRLTGGAHGTESKDCAHLWVFQKSAQAQAYTDRIWARTAWYGQITSGNYKHLVAALKSGNPYTKELVQGVAHDVGRWGSDKFANAYITEVFAGGPPPTLKAPQALRGWTDLQRAFNTHLPQSMHASQKARAHAHRQLRRAGKVHI